MAIKRSLANAFRAVSNAGGKGGRVTRETAQLLVPALVTGIANSLRNSDSYTKTITKKKTKTLSDKPDRGRRRKSKKRKLSAVGTKLPRGISKKFHNKVTKSVNFSKNWGRYAATEFAQLRQIYVDNRGTIFANPQGYRFRFGSPREIIHVASHLWLGKADTPNWNNVTTGNFANEQKFDVTFENVDFFFKSTSSHVVNIEMYECTSKKDLLLDYGPVDYILNSYLGDYDDLLTFVNDSGATVTQSAAATDLNSSSKEWVELYNTYNVKVHRFKLQPGDHTSKSFQIMKNYTMDMSKCSENDLILRVKKGITKDFFFRILNDPTVSGTTGDIHHWPSNAQGGVAVAYTRRIGMVPPGIADGTAAASTSQKNAFKRSVWRVATGTSVDQQVVVQNPITVTAAGTT